jgi:glycine hydroxymethyltransferase
MTAKRPGRGLVKQILRAHEKWRLNECLNLLASENFSSPAVRRMLSSDLSNRYTSPDKFYMGTKYIDEIQTQTEELAKELFRCDYADVTPLSGHVADMITLTTLTQPGDKIMVVGKSDGGYPGISQEAYPTYRGLHVTEFPFDKENFNIHAAKAKTAIENESPKLVVFGASLILFPQPVRELTDSCRGVGARIIYDGSHVLGLIAGKQFQDPLREGADMLIGSTHKSFPGPQGGVLLTSNLQEQLRGKVNPALVDNAHWNRIAALNVALTEMKRFGESYAKQVIRNSQTLGKALHEHGVNLLGKNLGFTKSHQIIVDVPNLEQANGMARRLEESNMIVDVGIRVGACEETRRGMREPEMHRIAELISRVWVKRENSKTVKRDVRRLRNEFRTLRFC